MPTKNPRIHVVLERPLLGRLKGLARRHGLSMSLEARELIREGLAAGRSARRPYTGKHLKGLIGRLHMGADLDPEDELGRQVHG